MFHTHKWVVTGQTYTPPSEYPFGDINGTGGTLRIILEEIAACRNGETHIYLRCTTCGDISSRTVPGDATSKTEIK